MLKPSDRSQLTYKSGVRRPRLPGEYQILLILLALQIASAYLSLEVPGTQIYLDTRWLFGIIGFVMLPKWWQALMLTVAGSLAGFHQVSLLTAFLANMLFALPLTVVTRLVVRRILYRIPNNLVYGVAVAGLILAEYQLIITPLIWLVMAILDGTDPFLSIVSGWSGQRVLGESVIVAAIASLVLMYWRLYPELQRSLQEKEILVRELFHRTKNNMSVIQSMLSLRAARDPNPEVQQLVRETALRIHSIALVHDKLHKNNDLANIDLAEYLEDLARHVFQTSVADPTRIRLQLKLEPISLTFEQRVPVGLLVSELVTNAIRHAFPEDGSGTVTVASRELENTVEIVVADTGIGLPNGLNRTEKGALGLTIAAMLAEHQLRGTFTMESEDGVSARVRFSRE